MPHDHPHHPREAVPPATGPADPASARDQVIARAAQAWLSTLTPEQRTVACWPFLDPQRGDWSYVPRRREGLALHDQSGEQREAAVGLLGSALSGAGLVKAQGIMALQVVLDELERGTGPRRDPLDYQVTVFGDPASAPFGFRVEGHHLSVNTTVAGSGAVRTTPTFFGSQPARIESGPRAGERVMPGEHLLALELARGLSGAQRREAVLPGTGPGDVVTVRGRARDLGDPAGLPVTELGEGQRALLDRLLREHLGDVADDLAAPHLARARQMRDLRLAWAGGASEGEPYYYRVHGSRLLVELDNTQDRGNHIHAVWRDPVEDWGRDVLGEHYLAAHDDD